MDPFTPSYAIRPPPPFCPCGRFLPNPFGTPIFENCGLLPPSRRPPLSSHLMNGCESAIPLLRGDTPLIWVFFADFMKEM